MISMVFAGAIGINIMSYAAGSTVYDFETKLPFFYENTYLEICKKETDLKHGFVKLTSKSSKCDGADAWFADENKNRITNVVEMTDLNHLYMVYYDSNYLKGSKVGLGIEDYDNTVLFKHSVKGYVNYK